MNTFEKQELQAQKAVNWSAAIKTGLGMGLYLFIFAGGAPWLGAGAGNGVLGRAMGWPWGVMALAHFGLCVLYICIIAEVIYRFSTWIAIAIGTFTALGIYLVTYPFFAVHNVGDARALAAHLVLGLFGSAIYKAISVPKVRDLKS
jgi:hypothetical protein